MTDYRWIVTVKSEDFGKAGHLPYSREVTTDGPRPDEAAKQALDRIGVDRNDLWQSNGVLIRVERVR